MKTIRRAWLLYRLVRRLERDGATKKAATFSVLIEPKGRYEERVRVAVANGEAYPVRECGYEVMYADDASRSAMVRKGWTLEEALGRALDLDGREGCSV